MMAVRVVLLEFELSYKIAGKSDFEHNTSEKEKLFTKRAKNTTGTQQKQKHTNKGEDAKAKEKKKKATECKGSSRTW